MSDSQKNPDAAPAASNAKTNAIPSRAERRAAFFAQLKRQPERSHDAHLYREDYSEDQPNEDVPGSY